MVSLILKNNIEYCPWVSGEFVRELTGNSNIYGGKGKQYIEFIVHALKPMLNILIASSKEESENCFSLLKKVINKEL